MYVQSPLEAYTQLPKACKPSMGPLYDPAMLAQFLRAFNTASGYATEDPTLFQMSPAVPVVIALISMKFVWPPSRAPSSPLTADMASTHGSNILESCRLAPLTRTTNGMPRPSTMRCRLEPSLPLSVGLGPVSWPPGGLAPKSHQYWPGSNQFGHAREVAPTHRQHSSHANAANTSCRCHSPKLEVGIPMQYRYAEQTGCH